MKNIRALATAMCLFCFAATALAQSSERKASLFSVSQEDVTATLKVEGMPLVEQYAEVFRKHRKDAESAVEWNSVIALIVGMKETDLLADGDVRIDVDEDGGVQLGATSIQHLTQMLDTVNSVLATPQKLDVFLTEMDDLSKK